MGKKVTAREAIDQYLRSALFGDAPCISVNKLSGTFDGMVCTGFLAPRDLSVTRGEQLDLGKGVAARIIGIQPIDDGRADYSIHVFYLH
jgi:hypothetical protein